jgi:hypothetical protein
MGDWTQHNDDRWHTSWLLREHGKSWHCSLLHSVTAACCLCVNHLLRYVWLHHHVHGCCTCRHTHSHFHTFKLNTTAAECKHGPDCSRSQLAYL